MNANGHGQPFKAKNKMKKKEELLLKERLRNCIFKEAFY